VLPKFAAVVLDTPILKRQMRLSLIANNGVDYLDRALINRLVFPVPPEATQRKVIEVYELASSGLKSAQNKATQLIADIDDYLLPNSALLCHMSQKTPSPTAFLLLNIENLQAGGSIRYATLSNSGMP